MFRALPLSSIIVNRDERQRRELFDIDELAASIQNIGLINPIVIDRDNVLVAGERRLAAHKLLGWDQIMTQLRDDLSPLAAQLLELEENVKRAQLPWRDECLAVFKYHSLRQADDTAHTLDDTARELAMPISSVKERLHIQAELNAGNELVLKADSFSVARNLTLRAAERRADAEAESIARLAAVPFTPAIRIHEDGSTTVEPLTVPAPVVPDEADLPIKNLDFIEWAPTYTGPRFNFIHCDFPYGVRADKHDQGAAKYFKGYEDNPETYWTLLACLGDNIERLCSDSAHLIFWFSMDYYHDTVFALTQMGWKVNPFPLIWFKSDNTGILPDPSRGPRRVYETAFLCSRGDRKIVQPVANCFPAPVIKTVHMSQKNTDMLRHFFRMTVDENTVMLDPTCGSGSALYAAEQLRAQSILGLEKDPEIYEASAAQWRTKEKTKELELDL
jgi:ParB-like chromosome segregation protein Spo0J